MENTDNPRSTYFFDQAVPVFFWPKKPKPLLFFLGLNIIMVFLLGLILFVSVVSAAPSDPQAKPSTSIDLLTAAPTPVGSFFGFDTPTDPLPGDGTALDPYSRAGIQAKADTLAWQSCNNPGGLNVNCPFTQCTGRCPCFDFCRDGSCPGRDNSRVICELQCAEYCSAYCYDIRVLFESERPHCLDVEDPPISALPQKRQLDAKLNAGADYDVAHGAENRGAYGTDDTMNRLSS